MSDRASIFAANVAALGCSGLAPGPHDGWHVDWSGAWPSIAIETATSRAVTLHSRRAPIDEARAQLAEARGDAPWPPLVVLLGAGFGYAVEVVEADAPVETRVAVIEPFAQSAAAMLSRRDWRPLVEAGRLTMVVGPSFAGAGELWRLLEPRGTPPLVVEQPVIARVRPDAVAAARKIWERAAFDAAANNEARETLGGRYLVNTLFNLPRIMSGRDLRALEGAGRGHTTVVCGAGPSLNRNLETIRPHRADVVLVAVDTALRPMLEAGLTPDFVVALDPAALNARHLSGLSMPEPPLLVSEAALDPSAFDSFGDNVAFFRVGGNDPWPWLIAQGVDVPILAAWGSVLTSAFAFAELLGSDPIVLAGADLAWTDGQPYCRGTAFELDWGRVVLLGQSLPDYWRRLSARKATEHPADLRGAPTDTAPHLIAFRDWLVDRAATSGRRIVNLTGAGLFHGPAVVQWAEGSAPFPAGSAPAPRPLLAEIAKQSVIEGPARPTSEALQEQLAALRDDHPPLSDWIASYARSLDRAMLDLALRGAASDDSIPSSPVDSPRALIALPESLAILRAAREGSALPDWAAASPAWELRNRTRVEAPLAALLMRSRLGVSEAGGDHLAPVAAHLHLLYNIEWPQPALESAAALVIATAGRLRETPPGRTLVPRFRPAARGSTTTLTATPRGLERRAQLFLASTWLVERVARRFDNAVSGTALDLLDATTASLDQPPSAYDARVRVTVSSPRQLTSRWRAAGAVTTATLVDALRGALLGPPAGRPCLSIADEDVRLDVTWETRTIDGDVLGREYLGTAPYRILTDEGLPKCLIATPGLDATAIVTPRGQTASYRVREDASFERMAEWPAPIVGEVHGPEGEMAWTHTAPPRLIFRVHHGASTTEVEVAFQTYTAFWWQNLVVLTTSDGVWTWRPGEAPAKLADLAPAVLTRIAGDSLEADPLPLEGGRLVRTRLRRGWTIDLASRAVTERPLNAPGQRWSTHTTDERSATGYPHADMVSVERRRTSRTLVWPSPRAAVWIGESLLVNTTAGDVVLFDTLASALTSQSAP
jgi:hypothetical protein